MKPLKTIKENIAFSFYLKRNKSIVFSIFNLLKYGAQNLNSGRLSILDEA